VGVVLLWGARKIKCVIINVYAPCHLQAKKALWVDLLVALKVYETDHICVSGDFNSVRSGAERKGVRDGGCWSEDTRLFNVLVENSGLVDLPLLGRKFTWVQPNGNCMSRLDRVLVSEGWLVEWGSVTLWGLKRDVSDHCPILVKYDGFDWGPKPFRFNNH
jgi:endonuclease/exonuclease/phosphatase family metal-dependent hydrolase